MHHFPSLFIMVQRDQIIQLEDMFLGVERGRLAKLGQGRGGVPLACIQVSPSYVSPAHSAWLECTLTVASHHRRFHQRHRRLATPLAAPTDPRRHRRP